MSQIDLDKSWNYLWHR